MKNNLLTITYPALLRSNLNVFFLILFATNILLSGCSSDNEQDNNKKEPEATFLDPQLKALKDAKKVEAELLERDKLQKKKIEEATNSKDNDTY